LIDAFTLIFAAGFRYLIWQVRGDFGWIVTLIGAFIVWIAVTLVAIGAVRWCSSRYPGR